MTKRGYLAFTIALAVSLFISGLALAQGDDRFFGILSETYVYPDGIRLDVDSKLFEWGNTVETSDDTDDKREGEKSLLGTIKYLWTGFGIAFWNIAADHGLNKNLSDYAGGSLQFWFKADLDGKEVCNLKVGIRSGGVGGVPVVERWVYLDGSNGSPVTIPADNQWRFISIPFSYFSGINFSKISEPFRLVNKEYTTVTPDDTFHFDNVRWYNKTAGGLDSIEVYPSSWTLPTGIQKTFYAQGYDTNSHIVDTYPAWSASGISGDFKPGEGAMVVFTPTSTSGSGSVSAAYSGESDSSAITIQDISMNEFFNIFIDEGVYGNIGTYDSDGTSANNSIALDTVTDVYPPGHAKSLKAAYSVTSSGWAGYYFQEGELTDTTSTKDLERFNDGYIHFWVKTARDLEIGIRTNNISEGYETSKLRLSEYDVPLNNSWQEVYVALDDFKIRDRKIDLTKSKVLFNAAVVGKYTGGCSGNFHIGDLRYLRRKETSPALSVEIKKRIGNSTEPSGQIGFSTAEIGGGWKIADQYLEIAYDTPYPSWGAQLYTDNLGSDASPKYDGDPEKYLFQQPVGMIGETEAALTCPMACMALDDINQDIPLPVEEANGYPENHPDFRIYFKSDTGGMWGLEEAKGEWSWLKDLGSTIWDDKDEDLELDIEGNFGDPNYEIVPDFSTTGDEYSTFLNAAGIGTGWGNVDGGERIYILNPETPIFIYLAARFRSARVKQHYTTNSIILELYHY
ncbi:MAG: hypothetical protein ISS34_04995 [Candidatus Omnitrophica bacterium]|nr:hypothetical protein [Candidatus Omnitrophota bacterium]